MILSICMIYNYAYSEQSYYYGIDNQIPIAIISDKVALYDENGTAKDNIMSFLSQHQLTAIWKRDNLCVVEDMTAYTMQTSFAQNNESILYLPIYLIDNKIEAILLPEIVLGPINDSHLIGEFISQYNMTLKKDGEIYHRAT